MAPHPSHVCTLSASILRAFGFPKPLKKIFVQSLVESDHSLNLATLPPRSISKKFGLNIRLDARPPRPAICRNKDNDIVARLITIHSTSLQSNPAVNILTLHRIASGVSRNHWISFRRDIFSSLFTESKSLTFAPSAFSD